MPTATKIKFAARYLDNKIEVYSNPGTGGIEKEYAEEIDDMGAKKIVCVGERNLYQEIQSHKEECLIENILKRVTAGDMSDFRPDGIYQDTTEIPTNMIEAQKAINKLESFWNKQPQEVKDKYNNDPGQFIAKAGTEAWLIDTGIITPPAPEPTPDIKTIITEPAPDIKSITPEPKAKE